MIRRLLCALAALAFVGSPVFAQVDGPAGKAAFASLPSVQGKFNVRGCPGLANPGTADHTADLAACVAAHSAVFVPNGTINHLFGFIPWGSPYGPIYVNGFIQPAGTSISCTSIKTDAFEQLATGVGTTSKGNVSVKPGNLSVNDTITLNGVAITAVASGATGNQINIGASEALTAANLNTFINANSAALTMTSTVDAAQNTTVDLVSTLPGIVGNATTLAVSNATTSYVSGSNMAVGGFTFASDATSTNGFALDNCAFAGNNANVETQVATTIPGASVSGTTLTVPNAPTGAPINLGGTLAGGGILAHTSVQTQLTNTDGAGVPGKTGTYRISINQTIAGPVDFTESPAVNMRYEGNELATAFAGYSSGGVIPHSIANVTFEHDVSGTAVVLGAYGRDSFFENDIVRRADNYAVIDRGADSDRGMWNVDDGRWGNWLSSADIVTMHDIKSWGCANYSVSYLAPDGKHPRCFVFTGANGVTGTNLQSQESEGMGFDFLGSGSNTNNNLQISGMSDADGGANPGAAVQCVSLFKTYNSQINIECGKLNANLIGTPVNAVNVQTSTGNIVRISGSGWSSFPMVINADSAGLNDVTVASNDKVYATIAFNATWSPRPDQQHVEKMTATGNVSLANPPSSTHLNGNEMFELWFKQDATGSRTLTISGSEYSGTCTVSAGANTTSILSVRMSDQSHAAITGCVTGLTGL